MLYYHRSSGKQVKFLYETVAVRYIYRSPLTRCRKAGTTPLEFSEKAEAFRTKSEDPQNKPIPQLAVPSRERVQIYSDKENAQ